MSLWRLFYFLIYRRYTLLLLIVHVAFAIELGLVLCSIVPSAILCLPIDGIQLQFTREDE